MKHNNQPRQWVRTLTNALFSIIDITGRKKAEAALRESEKKYRFLFTQMTNAGVVFAPVREGEDFVIVDLNKAAEQIENVSKEAVIGQLVTDVFPGVKDFGLFSVLQRVWRTGEAEQLPTSLYTDDRIRGWRENFVYKLPTGELVAIYSDETSRKEAELELRRSENRYRRVVETVGEGIVVIKDGLIKFVNQGTEQLFGVEKDKLIGQHIQKFVDRKDLLHFMEAHERRMSGELVNKEVLVTTISRPSGEVRRIRVSSVPLAWEGELSSLCALDDITEASLLEDRQQLVIDILKILNNLYAGRSTVRDILEAIQKYTGIDSIGIRLKEGEDFPYFVYRGFDKEFIKLENSLCQQDRELCVIKDAQGLPILECMCGCVIRGRTDPMYPFFTKGGSFWTNSTTELLPELSNYKDAVGLRRRCNISGYESIAIIPLSAGPETIGTIQLNDRKKNMFNESLIHFMEELALTIGVAVKRAWQEDKIKSLEMAKTKDLLQSSRLLNSGIAHELRTPMQALLNCFELIREEVSLTCPAIECKMSEGCALKETTAQGIKNIIELINDGLERTEYSVKVLNSLSEYSKIASTDEIHLINVVPELKTIMRTLMFTDQFKGLGEDSFSLTENTGTGCSIVINRVDFSQLITNLCRNSIEAITHGNPKINIAVSSEDTHIRIVVTDNGKGIDRSLGDKIFEPYFSTKEIPEGYNQGLGLAMVRDIVAAYGGTIKYNSQPGHTEFITTFPCEHME